MKTSGIVILIIGVIIAIVVVGLVLTGGPKVVPKGEGFLRKASRKHLLLAAIALILIGIGIGLIVHGVSTEGGKYKAYLSRVYPAMDTGRPEHEYAELFHSLGWYYQCCNKNNTELEITRTGLGTVSGDKIIGPDGKTPNTLRYPAKSKYGSKVPVTWDALRCCEDQDYQLPVVPQGHFYDWHSFQYFNVPVITVGEKGYNFAGEDMFDGNHRAISTFSSQSPTTSFAGFPTYLGGKMATVTSTDPMALQDKIPAGLWAGPGPFYAGERSIMRAAFYPFGPQFLPKENRWTLSGERDYTKWLNLYITRKDAEAKLVKDRNTGKPWYNGFDKGDWAEIGHVQQIPGMPASTGYWYNYFGGGGTGVFHKYGKTPKVSKGEVDAMIASFPKSVTNAAEIVDILGVSPRNKTHTLFNLLWETRATTTLPQPSGAGGETYTNGSDLLKALYGTDDPWIITMWYANGYIDHNVTSGTNWTQYTSQYKPLGKEGPPDFDGFSTPSMWAKPAWLGGGGPNQKMISRQAGAAFCLAIPQLGAYKLPVQSGNNVSLGNLYGLMGFASSGVTFATIAAFFLQAEFGPDHRHELATFVDPPKPGNTLPNLEGPQFPAGGGTGGVGALTYAGMKYALTKVFMGNYFYDRVANGVSFDEPMNYFATILGYKDLQMPFNTNTNGYWSFENIYVGLPSRQDNLKCDPWAYTWRDVLIRKRKYIFITNGGYQGPAMAILNKLWGSTLANRDPFDVYSDKKSLPCIGIGGYPCKSTPQMSCTKGDLLDINKYAKTDYKTPVWEGTCTVRDNLGMNQESTATVLWDGNDVCHAPWSQAGFGVDPSKPTTLWPGMCCMGHSFCQASGNKPTFSAIWSNVPYGGLEYGTGVVPLHKADSKPTLASHQTSTEETGDGTLPPPFPTEDPRLLAAQQQLRRSLQK